jgi:MFS family permease
MESVAVGAPRADTLERRAATVATTGLGGTVLTVVLGEMLVQLGLTPTTAVLPSLAAAIGVSALDGAWIVTLYILALAGTLLVSGRLGDLLGHRKMFGYGALVYAAGSLGAALAPGFEALLAARAVQGVGGAMISGNNLAILARAVPPERRARMFALVATASSLAAVVGSALGTVALGLGGWQLLFLGPLPLALWAAARARKLPGTDRRAASVDWAGAGLLVLTITLLAFALNHPHTTTTDVVMPVFHTWMPLAAILAGTLFVVVERRVRVPLMDWAQLRNATFAAAVGVNAVLHLTMMGGLFLGPVLAVQGLGMDVAAGGMLMVYVQASMLPTTFLGGWLYDRTRSPWIRPAAAGVVALGLALWAVMGLRGSYLGLALAGALTGMGSGVLLAVNNTVIMTSLPAHVRGAASGMLETTRHFGHAFGVTIPTAILALVATSAAAGAGDGDATALRHGFFWACLAMAGLAGLGAGLAIWKRV